jgi:DNA-binding Lrp family transcriptional regulator
MAEMVRLITQRGPKIDEIARDIGVYKETVRYWYNSLLKNGFTIQASRNHEKLGMTRVIVVAELSEAFREHADAIFYSLGELAYVVSFAKTLPEGYYVLNASVPTECLNSWSEFMGKLKTMGIFRSIDSMDMDWARNVPMWANYYNFQTGTWEFDWNNKKTNPIPVQVESSKRQRYDETDLKILEQLQHNANTSLTEIFDKLGAKNYKTLAWHYKKHVFARGLIKGYQVNWTGAKYDFLSEKPVHRKHRYMWVDLLANEVTDEVKFALMGKLHQTPYLWLEAGGPGTYYARMVIPTEDMPEALEFLEGAMSLAGGKVRFFHMDQAHALYFTMPNRFYNERNQSWMFNGADLAAQFEELVQKIKAG